MPALIQAMSDLEQRVLLTPRPDQPLHQRIIRFGEVALTIKEKEHLGHEAEGDLPTRVAVLSKHLLSAREQKHMGKTSGGDPIPLRVKMLRQQLLAEVWEQNCDPAAVGAVRDALADVHLALQLYSYPGDYISSQPSVERMAETIEKFEEDIHGRYAPPKGKRRANLKVGKPICVKQQLEEGRMRVVSERLTGRLESALRDLMVEIKLNRE